MLATTSVLTEVIVAPSYEDGAVEVLAAVYDSYMIFSPAFKSLPEAPKNLVMGKINRVLSGEIKDAKYAHLTPEIRAAIRQILNAR